MTIPTPTLITPTLLTPTLITPTLITPTLRTSVKKSLFWLIAVAFVILIAIIVLAARGASGPDGTPLSATNPGPVGSMAIVEVLQDHGVTVVVADTLDQAIGALGDGENTTLMLNDLDQYLDDDQLRSVARLAHHTVLVEPAFRQLQALLPSVAAAGWVSGELEADCDITAVTRAESVLGDGSGYRLIDDSIEAELCLGSGDDSYSLIQTEIDGRLVTVLGTASALSNEHVAEHGNAALALNLFGGQDTLVWYQPTIADIAGADAPTIAELTPAWLSLVMALLLIVVVAAGVWRGRRMGPLVVENLPVTVPSSETMEGRARLYQKASARLRALDSLRIGTISRLAAALGLPRTASADEVVSVAAAVTGKDHGHLRQLLLDSVPETDRDLIRLSDELLTLERAVIRASRPTPPPTDPGRMNV